MTGVKAALVVSGLVVSGAGLLSLVPARHWTIRCWDFLRLQLASMIAGILVLFVLLAHEGTRPDHAFVLLLLAVLGWHLSRILPYTALGQVEVPAASDAPGDAGVLRVVASNVKRDNHDHDRWLAVMRDARPDVVLMAEVDLAWMAVVEALRSDLPHVVSVPQRNHYGMALLSRYPLSNTGVRYLCQDDVPSIRATMALPSGTEVTLVGIHPRPPVPFTPGTSARRDRELLRVADEVVASEEPVVVLGDFNDVAWSTTSRRFQTVGGLLDPRRGRGLCNSFHAQIPVFRFPLDHVFVSRHFALDTVTLLPDVGSDHFPVFVALTLPAARPV